MQMKTKEIDKKKEKSILNKRWINRSEFKELIGIDSSRGNYFFNQIKKNIKSMVESKGLVLPDSNHIPIDLAIEELRKCGIYISR